jgi:hypothetical protein
MLLSRHVFLDTEVFVRAAFDFSPGSSLHVLGSAGRDGRVAIHITDVVAIEVRNRIHIAMTDAESALARARKDTGVLRMTDSHHLGALFAPSDLAAAEADLLAQFEDFLTDSGANVISTRDVAMVDVLAMQHAGKPPFGRGKKKNEYADAFTCEALRQWCGRTGESIYIVSGDGDLARAVEDEERFHGAESIAEMLQKLVEAEQPGLPELATEVFHAKWTEISSEIARRFESLGFILADQWGDVEDVVVETVEIEDLAFIEVVADTVHAVATVTVGFDARVTYDDYETAIYDSEEKRAIPWQTVDRRVDRLESVDVAVEIRLDRDHPKLSSVMSVGIQATDIEVQADEWEDYK